MLPMAKSEAGDRRQCKKRRVDWDSHILSGEVRELRADLMTTGSRNDTLSMIKSEPETASLTCVDRDNISTNIKSHTSPIIDLTNESDDVGQGQEGAEGQIGKLKSVQVPRSQESTDDRFTYNDRVSVLDLEDDNENEEMNAQSDSSSAKLLRQWTWTQNNENLAVLQTKAPKQVTVQVPQLTSRVLRQRKEPPSTNRMVDADLQMMEKAREETASKGSECTGEKTLSRSTVSITPIECVTGHGPTERVPKKTNVDNMRQILSDEGSRQAGRSSSEQHTPNEGSNVGQWRDTHLICLLPERWAIMVTPESELCLPAGAADLPPPPPGYQRPTVTKHAGYLIKSDIEMNRKSGVEGFSKATFQTTELGDPVVLKVFAKHRGGFCWISGRSNKMVARDSVGISPPLPVGAEFRNLITDMVGQWKRQNELEQADLRKRWNTWRKTDAKRSMN